MDKAPQRRGTKPKSHNEDTPGWARRLRAAREGKGMGIGDLAEASGLKRDAVGRYDAGERTPDVLDGLALARALGVDPRELYG